MKLSYNTVDSLLVKIQEELFNINMDHLPLDVEDNLKKEGKSKVDFQKEQLQDFQNDIKTLWPAITPHIAKFCASFEEKAVKSPDELFAMLQRIAREELQATKDSVHNFDDKEEFLRFANKGKNGLN